MIGREYIWLTLRWRVIRRWATPASRTHVCEVCGDIRELPRGARGAWAAEHVHGRDLPLRDGVFTHRRLGDGPRNVLIEDVETGPRVCRPFRGVPMIPVEGGLTEEMVERAAAEIADAPQCYCDDDWRQPKYPHCPKHGDGPWPQERHRQTARAILLAAGPWTDASADGFIERVYARLDGRQATAKSLDRPRAIKAGIDALHYRQFCVGADTCEAEPIVVAVVDAILAMQGGDAR